MFPTQPLQLDDSTDFKSLPSSSVTSSSSSKKRHLSQSSLDVYFVSSLSSGSGSAHKKTSKTVSKSGKLVSKKEHKKSPGKSKTSVSTKSPTKPPTKHSSPKSLILVTNNSSGSSSSSSSSMPLQSTGEVTQSLPKPQTPRTPVKTPTKSPLLSRTTSTSVITSAKKTRTLKQIRELLRRGKYLTVEYRIKLEGEMKRKLEEKKEERKKVRDESTFRGVLRFIMSSNVNNFERRSLKKRNS